MEARDLCALLDFIQVVVPEHRAALYSYIDSFLFRLRPHMLLVLFFFSSRRRHTRYWRDWSSDVCSSDLAVVQLESVGAGQVAVGGDGRGVRGRLRRGGAGGNGGRVVARGGRERKQKGKSADLHGSAPGCVLDDLWGSAPPRSLRRGAPDLKARTGPPAAGGCRSIAMHVYPTTWLF